MNGMEMGGWIGKTKDIARRGALAGMVAFSPLMSEQVSALEGLDGKDWQSGSELFMHQARYGEVEAGGMYVQYENGSEGWLTLGQKENVTEVRISIRDSIHALQMANRGGQRYTSFCPAHSHSISAGVAKRLIISTNRAKDMRMGKIPTLSFPPSAEDLKNFSTMKVRVVGGVVPNGESVSYRQMVFTPDGAYYFEPATDKYLRENFPKALDLRVEVEKEKKDVMSISARITDKNARAVDNIFQYASPELRHQFVEELKIGQYSNPSTQDIISMLLLNSGYDIPDSVLAKLQLSTEDQKTVLRYRELLLRTTVDGVSPAQSAFGEISMSRVPTSEDYRLLYAQYADAGWAIRYVSREDIQKEGPCLGIPGNDE